MARLGRWLWLAGLWLIWTGIPGAAGAAETGGQPVRLDLDRQSSWTLLLPDEGPVVFHGMVDQDDGVGGAHNAVMYPGNNAGTFLAAVLTHGLLVEASRKNQRTRIQEAADRVLDDYRPSLAGFTYADLMTRAQGMTAWAGNGVAAGSEVEGRQWRVESLPVFTLTQDQRAIVLDNPVLLRKAGTQADEATLIQVRVVSQPRPETEPGHYWTAAQGQALRDESIRLVAQSLDIAFEVASQDAGQYPQKTLRYMEGGVEKIERAQLLREQCGRLLLRNLRGVLMSVPAARRSTVSPSAGSCGALSQSVQPSGG
ncbi:MAG: hypothetical protein AB1899_11860 [Pseudomonadota bacterium]